MSACLGSVTDGVVAGAVIVSAQPGSQQLPLGTQPFHRHPAVMHGVGCQGLTLQIHQCLLINADGLLTEPFNQRVVVHDALRPQPECHG